MDERLLLRVLTRLVRIHGELGDEYYRDAVRGALVAIGRSAMRAAECDIISKGNVVPMPLPRSDDWVDEGGDDAA